MQFVYFGLTVYKIWGKNYKLICIEKKTRCKYNNIQYEKMGKCQKCLLYDVQ